MAQRNSGYDRLPNDKYVTEPWVIEDALAPHIPKRIREVWEPAQGNGDMVKALRRLGLKVIGTDIETGTDFLTCKTRDVFAVITNPPFDQEEEFIERALAMTRKRKGFVAMVARPGFSYAKTRYHLFAGCPCYAGKIEMTRRIEWFPRKPPDFNGPSEYHCWLLWDWRHRGPPVHLFYYEPKHMEAA